MKSPLKVVKVVINFLPIKTEIRWIIRNSFGGEEVTRDCTLPAGLAQLM